MAPAAPARFGVWSIVTAFLFGGLVAVVLLDRLLGLEPDNVGHVLLEFGGTFMSTFVGAWAAFLLQSHRDDVKARAGRAAALRRAQFALTAQENVLHALRTHLEPHRADRDRYITIGALGYYQDTPTLALSDLSFLLESTPELLNELLNGHDVWSVLLGLVEQQSDAHHRFQERLGQAMRTGAIPPGATPEQVGGPDLLGLLRSTTDSLYDTLARAFDTNEALFKKLADQIVKQFPGERPLKRSFDPAVLAKRAGGPPITKAPT